MYLNNVSKFVYYLIFFSPIIILGLSYYLTKICDWVYQYKIYVFLILFIVVLLGTKIIIEAFINKVIDRLKAQSIPIQIEEIEIYDSKSICTFFSYVIPIVSLLLDIFDKKIFNINPLEGVLVYCVLFSIFLRMHNNIQPNPMLVFCGYHFYKIKIKDGVRGYLLMSKKDIRSIDELTTVHQCFSYACIDLRR